MNRNYSHQALFAVLLLLGASPLVAAKVKVFILIGQSNMYGAGKVDQLVEMKDTYQEVFEDNSEFASRSDVRLVSNQIFRIIPLDFPATDLSVGAGMHATSNGFGPEIGFGWTVGDEYDEPILLIKCAFGGTHLGVEWRSPSAPVVDYGDEFHDSDYGSIWRLMALMVDKITSDIGKYVPGQGGDFEISGVLWMQGWNDAFNDHMRDDYETNLAYFVEDLLEMFGSNIPIVIAELGQEGDVPQQYGVKVVRQAQLDVVARFAMQNVVFLPTSPYVEAAEPHLDGIHHYYGRADTVMEIGKAFGREIIFQSLLTAAPPANLPANSPINFTFDAPAMAPVTESPYIRMPKSALKASSGRGGTGGK
jgi:hypothetical protein